jgi:glycosyltransferase involved in cell wall biosynthesis
MIFFTSYLNEPHGAAKSALDFLKALTIVCNDVTVIAPKKVELPIEIAGYKPVSPKWYGLDAPFKKSYKLLVPGTSNQKQLFKEIFNRICKSGINNKDIVIVNSWASKKKWDVEKRKFKGKRVLIVRESLRHFTDKSFRISLENMISFLNEFDFLIFVSELVMNEWSSHLTISKENCFFLPNCIDEEAVQQIAEIKKSSIKKELGFYENDIVIIYPGTIEYRKGQDLIIDFYDSITRIDPRIKLFILGDSNGVFGDNILKQINKINGIIRLPAQKSALEYIYLSDILLFPSRAEAMPRTILEAMAFGMPVVASTVDGIPELIIDGFNGFLFDIDKPEIMVEKIATLIRNPDLMIKFSERSKERYYKLFSRSKQIERLRVIIDSIEAKK